MEKSPEEVLEALKDALQKVTEKLAITPEGTFKNEDIAIQAGLVEGIRELETAILVEKTREMLRMLNS